MISLVIYFYIGRRRSCHLTFDYLFTPCNVIILTCADGWIDRFRPVRHLELVGGEAGGSDPNPAGSKVGQRQPYNWHHVCEWMDQLALEAVCTHWHEKKEGEKIGLLFILNWLIFKWIYVRAPPVVGLRQSIREPDDVSLIRTEPVYRSCGKQIL